MSKRKVTCLHGVPVLECEEHGQMFTAMTNQPEQTLDEILLNFAKRVEDVPRGKTYGWSAEKSQIIAAINGIIGETEGQHLSWRTLKPYKNDKNRQRKIRDKLRYEQQERAARWLGNGGDDE